MSSLARPDEVEEGTDEKSQPSSAFGSRLEEVQGALTRVNKAAELSAAEINNSLEIYAQATKENKEMERIAERPGFNIISQLSFSSIFAYFLLLLIVGAVAYLMAAHSEETGWIIGLVSGGLFLMLVLFVGHSMLYGIAHKDLQSHGEFVQYVIGKTVMDKLYAVKDLRQYIAEFEAQIGSTSTAAETAKEKIARFIRNVALNRPVELFGLSKVKEEVDSTRTWGKAIFFIVLILLVGGIGLLVSSLVFTVQKTFVVETLLNSSIQSDNEGKKWAGVASVPGWTPRAGHAAVALGVNKVLVVGGAKGMSDVWEGTYDPEKKDWSATKKWKQKTASAAFGSRTGHAVVRMSDGKLILVGGRDFADGQDKNDVYESTNDGATWTKVAHAGDFGARRGHSLLVVPPAIAARRRRLTRSAEGDASAEEKEDEATAEEKEEEATAEEKPTPPGPNLLIIGGSSSMTGTSFSSDNGRSWLNYGENAVLGARSFHVSAVLGELIVVFGGLVGGEIRNDVVISKDGGATWKVAEPKEGSPVPEKRIGAAKVVSGTALMVIGGKSDKQILNDVWQLTIDGGDKANWSRVTENVVDEATKAESRAFGAGIRLGSRVLVLGGERSVEAAKKKGVAGVEVQKTNESVSQLPIVMISVVGGIVLLVAIGYVVMHNKFYKVMYKEVPEMYVVTNREWVRTLDDIGKSPEKYDSGAASVSEEAARSVARSVASTRAKSLTPDELARRQQQSVARSIAT